MPVQSCMSSPSTAAEPSKSIERIDASQQRTWEKKGETKGGGGRNVSVLPLEVVQRIAAGAVIYDYASVVRELMENALDANAGSVDVDVDVERGVVAVCDDGNGIPDALDLRLVAGCNATSKLRSLAELEAGVCTLGFRGQGLWAVAATCGELSVASRVRGQPCGLRVRFGRDGTPLQAPAPVAMAQGTAVVAEGLPWRELPPAQRTKAFRRCRAVIVHAALCHPRVALRLTRARRPVWSVSPAREDGAAIAAILAREAAIPPSAVAHVEVRLDSYAGSAAADGGGDDDDDDEEAAEVEGVEVLVAVASPAVASATSRDTLVTAVNGRPVRLPAVARAVAAGARVRRGRFPVAFVALRVPPRLVDWNVCPAKTRMQLRDPGMEVRLVQLVTETVARLLRVPRAVQPPTPALRPAAGLGNIGGTDWGSTSPVAGLLAAMQERAQKSGQEFQEQNATTGTTTTMMMPPTMPAGFLDARVVAQLLNTYILVEHAGGIVLIEQHVADERVLYERLLACWREQTFTWLGEAIEVTRVAGEETAFRLTSLGFDVDVDDADDDDNDTALTDVKDGSAFIRVRSVPQAMVDIPRPELAAIVTSLAADDVTIDDAAAAVACRLAVRNGRPLDDRAMNRLVRRLFACDNGHTCPHGRPIFHHLDTKQLASLFGRNWSPERSPSQTNASPNHVADAAERNFVYGILDE